MEGWQKTGNVFSSIMAEVEVNELICPQFCSAGKGSLRDCIMNPCLAMAAYRATRAGRHIAQTSFLSEWNWAASLPLESPGALERDKRQSLVGPDWCSGRWGDQRGLGRWWLLQEICQVCKGWITKTRSTGPINNTFFLSSSPERIGGPHTEHLRGLEKERKVRRVKRVNIHVAGLGQWNGQQELEFRR